MKAKKIYSYHIDTENAEKGGEVGEYYVSHRTPLEVGDYVVLEVYPAFDDEHATLEEMTYSQENPPEYCVLGQVSRFTEDGGGVYFMIVGTNNEFDNR